MLFYSVPGSLTLHHWQRLAQPHMASMLDQRPGVMVKGFREIDRSEMYSLEDIEDDGQVVGELRSSQSLKKKLLIEGIRNESILCMNLYMNLNGYCE